MSAAFCLGMQTEKKVRRETVNVLLGIVVDTGKAESIKEKRGEHLFFCKARPQLRKKNGEKEEKRRRKREIGIFQTR